MISTKINKAWHSHVEFRGRRDLIKGIALNELDYDELEKELKGIQRSSNPGEPASWLKRIMFALPGHLHVEVYRCTPMFEGVRFML